jgi:hypothetical protein
MILTRENRPFSNLWPTSTWVLTNSIFQRLRKPGFASGEMTNGDQGVAAAEAVAGVVDRSDRNLRRVRPEARARSSRSMRTIHRTSRIFPTLRGQSIHRVARTPIVPPRTTSRKRLTKTDSRLLVNHRAKRSPESVAAAAVGGAEENVATVARPTSQPTVPMRWNQAHPQPSNEIATTLKQRNGERTRRSSQILSRTWISSRTPNCTKAIAPYRPGKKR